MDGLLVYQTLKLLGIKDRKTLYSYEEKGWISSRRDINNFRRFALEDVIDLKEKLNSPRERNRASVQ